MRKQDGKKASKDRDKAIKQARKDKHREQGR